MNQRHVHLKYLHPFWTPIYFTIPPNERIGGKLGIARITLLFHSHPEWKPNGSAVDRKIKVDMEAGYQSAELEKTGVDT